MTRGVVLVLALVLSLPVGAASQTTVFLVRHAERADNGPGGTPPMTAPGAPAADPDLSDAGRARAAALAAALKDANITAIYATDLKRTQQTAAPLAQALGLTVIVVPATAVPALIAKVRARRGNALVVGHSNTVPEVIKGLGVKTAVQVRDTEYDNLFLVVRGGTPEFLRLHYGKRTGGAVEIRMGQR
ncbi:MAG: histidine phosphatase family protein [Acidobacteriota bacterium]